MICKKRNRPNKEPKFHNREIFIGAGRSVSLVDMIFISGWSFRTGFIVNMIL